jgi:hypothetical protein
MPNLEDYFDALTRVRPPDGWREWDHRETLPPAPPSRRPRRVGVTALALLVAAGGVVIAVRAFPTGHQEAPEPATQPNVGTPQPNPSEGGPTPTQSAPPQSGMFGAMLDAIRNSSPTGWRFTLTSDRLDGDWRLDGNADDGSGPGRLYVDLTVRPGMFEADPCADSEFRQGARCVRRPASHGDLLFLRDVVTDGDMKTIEVVLVHPDRSGVEAEAGNWTIASLPSSTPAAQQDLPTPRVTRPEPLYTVYRLAQLVLAVDEGTRSASESTAHEGWGPGSRGSGRLVFRRNQGPRPV